MVDFKETAKEIFDICTNIAKADGRATEKIEAILRQVYENGRDDYKELEQDAKTIPKDTYLESLGCDSIGRLKASLIANTYLANKLIW